MKAETMKFGQNVLFEFVLVLFTIVTKIAINWSASLWRISVAWK